MTDAYRSQWRKRIRWCSLSLSLSPDLSNAILEGRVHPQKTCLVTQVVQQRRISATGRSGYPNQKTPLSLSHTHSSCRERL